MERHETCTVSLDLKEHRTLEIEETSALLVSQAFRKKWRGEPKECFCHLVACPLAVNGVTACLEPVLMVSSLS